MMRLLVLAGLLAGLLASGPPAARAQTDASRRARAMWRAEARARVSAADTLLAFRTRPVAGGRMDVEAGVLRAAYRVGTRVAPGLSAQAAARAYLAEAAAAFGWGPAADDLVLASVQAGRYSIHLVFQQTFFGLPVYNRQVKVNLNRAGQPTMVLSGYAPHLQRMQHFDPQPSLSPEAARSRVQALAEGNLRMSAPELVVYPSKAPRLAWRLLAWPEHVPAEWEVLLDAQTGEVIHLIDQSTHAHRGEGGSGKREEGEWEGGGKGEWEKGGMGEGARTRIETQLARRTRHAGLGTPDSAHRTPYSALGTPRSALRTRHSPLVIRADGSGLVFDPDPLTTAGVPYGPPYVDGDNADIPELNAERIEVPLYDLTHRGGMYYLEGPYVQIDGDGSIGGTAYTPPAEPDPHAFRYTRGNDFFEAVMAYYHIDQSQRYVQLLDVGRPIQQAPIRVNPHGLGSRDDSKFFAAQNAIAFGRGGVDDAEDADVIWHEYAHALLEDSAPGLLLSSEGQALHEGWADYWAASYSRWQMERGLVPMGEWPRLFNWDGNETWCGRRLDHPGRYPDEMAYVASPGCEITDIYQHGLLWATTLMEIHTDLGRDVTDRLNLASHAYLSHPVTMQDAAEALLQADIDLYGGTYRSALRDRLGARGFVDSSAHGPVITHAPLPSTEQLGGFIRVEATVTSAQAPVDSVLVFHRTASGASFDRLVLSGGGGSIPYEGDLPLPPQADTVFYYVVAVDELGYRARLPSSAPEETLRFSVGPDEVPPQILHDPVEQVALAGWPVEVVADVVDNLGVDSVWVTYAVTDPGGAPRAEGAFGLDRVQPLYRGVFPVAADQLQDGSAVAYRLHARDRASAANESAAPESGTFTLAVSEQGVLRAYDFEGLGGGLASTGVWRRGAPTYGLRVARSGEQVWRTNTGAAYPDQAQLSSLELPPLNLEGLEEVYLLFWHWHDLEHSDQPDNPRLWDGANVKVSTDGGVSWQVVEPEGGYDGIIDANYDNPLGGQRGFGGYSYGWQRAVVTLPPAADVRVRFDFGTDTSNSDAALYYAGWVLDDVSVTTLYPHDDAPPLATALPPALMKRRAGQVPPMLVVEAEDDTGVAAVWADYQAHTDSGTVAGTLRLAMSEHDLRVFRGVIPLSGLGAGNHIDYRLRLVDAAGNEQVYEAPDGDAPFRIEYRLMESTSVLSDVRATGLWQPSGDAWYTLPGPAPEERSSLVFEPFDLPRNADDMSLLLEHRYRLDSGFGGNVKISQDGGKTWSVLAPETAYDAAFAPGVPHAMEGEAVFTGNSEGFVQTLFDVAAYAGQQVRLRIDFASTGALTAGEGWTVQRASLFFSTLDDALEMPRTLALHPNFPDPFSSTTTISYTLPETLPVRLEVFDLLGRRVAVLVNAEQAPDTYTITFDGSRLASGVYLMRLMAGSTQMVERMMVAR